MLALSVGMLLCLAPSALAQVSFSGPTNYAVGNAPVAVTVGDFDGDAQPDLAVANRFSNSVSVLLGGGGGSFGAATSFPVGVDPRSVAVGDFNGDSDPDLAVANTVFAGISVLTGDGAGSFAADTGFSLGDIPRSVVVGDFNGDSNPTSRSRTRASTTCRCC